MKAMYHVALMNIWLAHVGDKLQRRHDSRMFYYVANIDHAVPRNDLPEACQLAESTVTRILKRLVDANLLSVDYAKGNQREKFVSVTQEGRTLIDEINLLFDQIIKDHGGEP